MFFSLEEIIFITEYGDIKMLNFEKTVMIINWFARQCHGKSIDKLDLLKMIYMVDRYHLRRFGRLISGDNYYAMKLGPVPSMAKNICDNPDELSEEQRAFAYDYLRVIGNDVHSQKSSDKNYFCPSEIEALNATRIKALLVKQSGESLPDFTHHFPEWKAYEQYLTTDQSSRRMDVSKFFSEMTGDDARFEYCPASSRLLKSNKQKFSERQSLENMIGSAND